MRGGGDIEKEEANGQEQKIERTNPAYEFLRRLEAYTSEAERVRKAGASHSFLLCSSSHGIRETNVRRRC